MLKTQEQINTDLRERDDSASEFQRKVLKYVRPRLKVASDKMGNYHTAWEEYDWIYRGYRMPDRKDTEESKEGKPSKIIVPLTFAQVQTAISFLMSTFLQREHFYELRGMGPEDEKLVFAMESDISYQLNKNQFPLKLYCWLLDAFKYGFGVVKTDWETRYCKMRTQRKEKIENFASFLSNAVSSFGFGNGKPKQDEQFRIIEEVVDVLEYEGNRIRNVSPFAFYPDPDFPISSFQDGNFVCHEEEMSKAAMKKMGLYHGLNKVRRGIPKTIYESRKRWAARDGIDSEIASLVSVTGKEESDVIVHSEIELVLTGEDVKKQFGVDLGVEDYYQRWIVSVANDDKVVRFQPSGYLHNQFNYDLIEYSPDANAFYNPGLSETIQELQSLVTFLLNSHIINVRSIVSNRLIYDSKYINPIDLRNNKEHIPIKGTVPGSLDRIVKQLEVSDVTTGHIRDMDVLTKLIQLVTGISENALGQYSAGRRSATEARNVNAGTGA